LLESIERVENITFLQFLSYNILNPAILAKMLDFKLTVPEATRTVKVYESEDDEDEGR